MVEAGFPTLEQRQSESLLKIIQKLLFSNNSIIDHDIDSTGNSKMNKRFPSTIIMALSNAKIIGLPIKRVKVHSQTLPPWHLTNKSFELNLTKYNKDHTNSRIYRTIFVEIVDNLKKEGWTLLFTDQSKSAHNTSFAITEENGTLLKAGILWEYSSIFTTEAFAIHEAAKMFLKSSPKILIFLFSLSVIRAVSNPNYNSRLINNIRDLLIKNSNNITLMWVPSHIGLLGNEYADKAEKSYGKSPVFTFDTYSKKKIFKDTSNKP